MNELIKLLDNNEILTLRADVPVDSSVLKFINLVFRLSVDKSFPQQAYHEDVIRLLQSTELFSYIKDRIGSPYTRKKTLIPDNYWVKLHNKLLANRELVSDFMFFYGGIFSSKGERDLLEFLKSIWVNHRNVVYQVSALLVIHLIGMRHLKDNLC